MKSALKGKYVIDVTVGEAFYEDGSSWTREETRRVAFVKNNVRRALNVSDEHEFFGEARYLSLLRRDDTLNDDMHRP